MSIMWVLFKLPHACYFCLKTKLTNMPGIRAATALERCGLDLAVTPLLLLGLPSFLCAHEPSMTATLPAQHRSTGTGSEKADRQRCLHRVEPLFISWSLYHASAQMCHVTCTARVASTASALRWFRAPVMQ